MFGSASQNRGGPSVVNIGTPMIRQLVVCNRPNRLVMGLLGTGMSVPLLYHPGLFLIWKDTPRTKSYYADAHITCRGLLKLYFLARALKDLNRLSLLLI